MILIKSIIILSLVALSLSFSNETVQNETMNETANANTFKSKAQKIGKRLETVEGVEIASSYKEYMDLALSDLEDRINKSEVKLSDFTDRIQKRKILYSEIIKEISRRKEMAKNFIEKDKQLRARLLRNTEMKAAINNLAEIAEYKLSSRRHKNSAHLKQNNLTEMNANQTLSYSEMNNTFIEMAYVEINNILALDKQTLVQVIRKKLNNDFKLKELINLEKKVSESLVRLESSKTRLKQLIAHDKDVEDILRQLRTRIKLEPDDKKKILSIIGFFKA